MAFSLLGWSVINFMEDLLDWDRLWMIYFTSWKVRVKAGERVLVLEFDSLVETMAFGLLN